jgi:hypothetical protein
MVMARVSVLKIVLKIAVKEGRRGGTPLGATRGCGDRDKQKISQVQRHYGKREA